MSILAASLVMTIQDGKGVSSNLMIHLPPGLPNIGRYQAMAKNWVDSVDAVITGRVTYVGVAFGLSLPTGIKLVADAASDVEEGARFIFRTVNGFKTRFRVPTFNEAKIVEGTKQVDITDADVESLIENVIDGIDDDDTVVVNRQNVTDERGEDIISLESAKEAFGKDRG